MSCAGRQGPVEGVEYVPALALIVTILLVYLRIRKQEESSLRLQAENHRSRLKAEIFEKLSDVLMRLGLAVLRCGASCLPCALTRRGLRRRLSRPPTLLSCTTPP